MKRKREQECIICTDNIVEVDKVALQCCHMYHSECVKTLVKKRTRKCPICRTISHVNISNHIITQCDTYEIIPKCIVCTINNISFKLPECGHCIICHDCARQIS